MNRLISMPGKILNLKRHKDRMDSPKTLAFQLIPWSNSSKGSHCTETGERFIKTTKTTCHFSTMSSKEKDEIQVNGSSNRYETMVKFRQEKGYQH